MTDWRKVMFSDESTFRLEESISWSIGFRGSPDMTPGTPSRL